MIPTYIAAWAMRKDTASHAAMHVGDTVARKPKKARKPKERVLESKGGKQLPPPPPDPLKEAEARNWEAQQAEERAAKVRAADDARKQIEDANKLQSWRGGRANAVEGVKSYGKRKLASYGMDQADPYGIWDMFTSTLDQRNNSLQDNQEYGNVLSNDVFDSALADARSTTRTKHAKTFKDTVGNNYFDDTFKDSIDDSILDSILGDQYTEAEKSLTNSRDRGQLNQFSFDRAISTLGQEREKARGELETIGRGVIGGMRDKTRSAYDDSISRANNFDFGDTYDAAGEAGKIRTRGTENLASLDTDIRRAIGGKQFFDPSGIAVKAGSYGGASNYNPSHGSPTIGSSSTNPLYKVFDDQARQKSTEGVF